MQIFRAINICSGEHPILRRWWIHIKVLASNRMFVGLAAASGTQASLSNTPARYTASEEQAIELHKKSPQIAVLASHWLAAKCALIARTALDQVCVRHTHLNSDT